MSVKGNNVTPFQSKSVADMQQALNNLLQCLPLQMKMNAEIAKMMKAYFDDLIKAGFTEAQAMELIKARGVQP